MKRKIRTIKERKAAKAFTLSRNCDDGEVLQQSVSNRSGYLSEYVVQSSITDIPFEEYIVMKDPAPGRYPVVDRTPYASGQSTATTGPVKDTSPKKQESMAPPSKVAGDMLGKKQLGYTGKDAVPESKVEEV